MKKRIVISIACGFLTTASVFAKPYALPTGGIDFRRVDGVMSAIEKEAVELEVQNGDNFASIDQAFDPARSSLENETLGYTVAIALKNAPWSDGKGTLSINSDVFLKTDRISPLKGVRGEVSVQTKGDILEIVRYTGKKILESPDVQYDKDFGSRERDLVYRMSNVSSIAGFTQLITDAKQLALEIADTNIARKIDNITCLQNLKCGDVTHDQWGNLQIDENQFLWAKLDLSQSIQQKDIIERNVIQADNNTFTLTISPSEYSDSNEVIESWQQSSVVVTPNSITVTTKGFVSVSNENLDTFHHDFENYTSAVEVDDPKKHADLLKVYRDELVSFRRIMNGHPADFPHSTR